MKQIHEKLLLLWLLFCGMSLSARKVGSDSEVAKQGKAFFLNEDSNEISGFSILKSGFILQNKTTICDYNAYFPISGDIVLNGGTLRLSNDLYLQSPVNIGNGKIDGNFFSLTLPHNVNNTYLPSQAHFSAINLTEEKQFSRRIFSLDWSYDGNYLAVGLDGSSNHDEIQIFEVVNGVLSLKASYDMGSSNDIRSIRWHPSSYYFVTGSITGNELQTWLFDSEVSSITLVDSENTDDVISLAWTPDGNYLAVGKNRTSYIYVYPVTNGTFGSRILLSIGHSTTIYDLSWSSNGNYLAIATKSSKSAEVIVYSFDGFTLNSNATANLNSDVYAIRWRPDDTFFSIGTSESTEQLKSYIHTDGVLSSVSSALVGETKTIFGLDWMKGGNYLAVAKGTDSSGLEVEIFYYNEVSKTFSMVAGEKLAKDAEAIAWHPEGMYLAVGDTTDKLYLYNFISKSLFFKDIKLIMSNKLVINGPILFQGSCSINGNNKIIDFSSTGSMLITEGAQLSIENATLTGLKGDKIHCTHDSSALVLNNVHWIQDETTTFSMGSILFQDAIRMSGSSIFAYQSSQTSTIAVDSVLKLSPGFTFSYDPSINSKDLLYFEDYSSELILNRSFLATTTVGMNLKKGTMIIENDANLSSEKRAFGLSEDDFIQIDEGINLGDGISSVNDFYVHILPGAELNLLSGSLNYRNIQSGTLKLYSSSSTLRVQPQAALKLYQNLSSSVGKFVFESYGILSLWPNINFDASIVPLGKLSRLKLKN